MEKINGSIVRLAPQGEEPDGFGPSETGGDYAVRFAELEPGEAPAPLHVHPHTNEAFYVSEGEATFLLGEREQRATAGSLVFVPQGTPHTVWNAGDRPVRGLIVISPGHAEHLLVPVEAAPT